MKAVLHIDLDEDNLDITIRDYLIGLLKKQGGDKSQQTLPNEGKESVRKYFCNNPSCKKEISKSEVAFCLHPENKDRFGGKVFCLKCQEEF